MELGWKMRVYLGGSKGAWRIKFMRRFPQWECYNPFKDSTQSCLAGFTIEDLNAIDECDLIVFYIDYPEHRGSCLEGGYAFAKGKPIITIWLHKGMAPSMLLGVSRRVSTSFEEAMKWIEKKYGDKT